MYKIIIIEDHVLLRDMIKDTLESEEEFEIVATSNNAKEIINLCGQYSPDLILSDVCTANNSSGIHFCGEAKKVFPELKVIIMTGILDINFINESKSLNIDSFIYKNISKESLINTIKNTLAGYSTYPNISNNENLKNNLLSNLSEKELEIFKLFCKGCEREEISNKLNISKGTLKNYITSILSKTRFDNISKLVIYCISEGFIFPNLNK